VRFRAQVAELVDALVSGISGGNIVGVRVPSWASFPRDAREHPRLGYRQAIMDCALAGANVSRAVFRAGLLASVIVALQAQTPSPVPSLTPAPQQIFATAFHRLQAYPVAPYAVWTTTWETHINTSVWDGAGDATSSSWLERCAVRTSDGTENLSTPDDPNGTIADGKLPRARIAPQIVTPFALNLRASVHILKSGNDATTPPDVASGLKTIAVVSASKNSDYAIENVGIESVNGHATYHLILRPLRNPSTHIVRELWVDVRTFDIWKAHYVGIVDTQPPAPAEFTSYFAPVAGYWVVTRSIYLYERPFNFREYARVTSDVQTNAVTFPQDLPERLFDSKEYRQREKSNEPDILGVLLNPPLSGSRNTPAP
jgi:hypothetical protein